VKFFKALPFFALLYINVAGAGELMDGFHRALLTDPTFQSARAEYEVGKIEAKRAGRAYWPELGMKYGERTEQGGAQATVQIAQPLFSTDRIATWLGADPMQLKAEANLRQRESELVTRYLGAVTELVRTRESVQLNQRKIEALGLQATGSRRAFELGTGTLTDQRDTQVRLDQARAEALGLKARLAAAERQFISITAEPAKPDAFILARKKRTLTLPKVSDLKDLLMQSNPQLAIARQNERLADLDVWRKRGAFMPQVNFVAKTTKLADGSTSNYAGLSLDYPIQSGSILGVEAAAATVNKAIADLRTAEQKALLDVEKLHALIEAGQFESDIRLDAIDSAELSVEGNKKSFKGGVRSQIDVLNSIMTLFQIQEEFIVTRLMLAANLGALHAAVGATPVAEIMKFLENLLFEH
jgi:outer membrane protein TolC